MIITRTPFRFTLGGGGTDLPSYYTRFGGLIFAAAIDKYMFISVNRPIVDDLVRVKYSISESVESADDLKHELAKVALNHAGLKKAIEIVSMADIPAGTGLGSSSCYLVGLLNALTNLKRDHQTVPALAETACHLEMEVLQKPVGKQDAYLAAFGGLPILEINRDGKVSVRPAKVDSLVLDELNRNTLLFYTGQTRTSESILRDQDQSVRSNEKEVTDSLHRIKEIGYEIIEALESGNIDQFGHLTHLHWETKKKLSNKIANVRHHEIYEIARENGALGGKITGAGGGGFFVFYVPKGHKQLRSALHAEGLREMRYRFDLEGSKVLVNFADGKGLYEPIGEQPFWSFSRSSDHGLQGIS